MNTSARCWALVLILLCSQPALTAAKESPGAAFTLPQLDASTEVSLEDLHGKVVYVDFWASWCGPCRKAMPLYETVYQEIGRERFEILAINLDENRQDAVDFLEQHPVSYPVLLDPSGSTAENWGIRVMPTSFLLDQNGVVVREFPGFETSDFEDIRHAIETLLAQ